MPVLSAPRSATKSLIPRTTTARACLSNPGLPPTLVTSAAAHHIVWPTYGRRIGPSSISAKLTPCGRDTVPTHGATPVRHPTLPRQFGSANLVPEPAAVTLIRVVLALRDSGSPTS